MLVNRGVVIVFATFFDFFQELQNIFLKKKFFFCFFFSKSREIFNNILAEKSALQCSLCVHSPVEQFSLGGRSPMEGAQSSRVAQWEK